MQSANPYQQQQHIALKCKVNLVSFMNKLQPERINMHILTEWKDIIAFYYLWSFRQTADPDVSWQICPFSGYTMSAHPVATDNGHAGLWHQSTAAKESSKQHMKIVPGSGIIRLFMPTSTAESNYTFWIQYIGIFIITLVTILLTRKEGHQILILKPTRCTNFSNVFLE